MAQIDEARDEIARYLPADHPALKRLDAAIDEEAAVEELATPEPVDDCCDAYDELVHLLDDFRRGIRTWDEIHDHVWPALP